MAIGSRISSTNLSGKTATVTFTPYTGSTSGSTVNLGTQTIPFNNITSHPYGDYAIYLAEYDYTYTLNIPEPVVDTQLYVVVDRNVNDNNYGIATFNFTDFTATILDFGVDTNLWNMNNLYPLQNSGYMYQFNGQNDYQDKLVIFTDATNAEIGRYTGNTNCDNLDSLNGNWVTYDDCNNGVFTYSDGLNVYTYTYDSSRYSFDIQWDYDATVSNKSFIVIKYDNGQGIDHHALLFKPDGTQSLLKSWTNNDGLDYNFQLQYNSDFFVIEKWENGPSQYTQIEIFDLNLNLLQTVSLSGATYNSRQYGFHGTNKYFNVFYDNNDNSVAYKIVHYNHDTTTLIETSHARGNEYESLNTTYNSDYGLSDGSNQGLLLTFLNYNGTWGNWGLTLSYYDIVYMLDGMTSFGTYTFANNEAKTIYPYSDQMSDIIRFKCDTGDGVASILTITSGTTNTIGLGVNVSDITWNDYWRIDNRSVYGIMTTGSYDNITLSLIGADGNIQDTKNAQYASTWGESQSRSMGKSFYFAYNDLSVGYIGWYVNDSTTGFTQTEYYQWTYNSDNYFKSDFRRNSDIVLYNFNDNVARVLTSNSISPQIYMPANGNKGFEVGEDMFMFYYTDTENNYYHVKLYDFSGNTLTTLDTTYTDYNIRSAVKNRFIISFWDSNNSIYVYYMLGPNGENHVSLGDYNRYDTANDIIWWD